MRPSHLAGAAGRALQGDKSLLSFCKSQKGTVEAKTKQGGRCYLRRLEKQVGAKSYTTLFDPKNVGEK